MKPVFARTRAQFRGNTDDYDLKEVDFSFLKHKYCLALSLLRFACITIQNLLISIF